MAPTTRVQAKGLADGASGWPQGGATDRAESAHADLSAIGVLPGVSAARYLALCRERQPVLYSLLRPDRVSAERTARLFADMGQLSTHFESKLEQGRGDSYREAQNKDFMIRAVGFLHLFDLAVPQRGGADRLTVLDSLGGNGTLTRIVRASRRQQDLPFIVTSDVSARMIESAFAQGLPAVRLPLENLIWFDDATFDAIIVAYGTHHIPPANRLQAIGEAFRVLKPGGRIVLQDFEIGCPTTKWYDDVLDRYTTTGHKFDYFTRQEFNNLLVGNGFSDVRVMDVYDPFILRAADPRQARAGLLNYLLTLFALEKLLPPQGEPDEAALDRFEAVIRETATFAPGELAGIGGISEFTVAPEGNEYRAEIPRVCLTATGQRLLR
jgi:SAM-dependent methyltransferase